MNCKFKIGSLFDGSGGFPLAAALCGGIPTWASEVEPYPIAVTRSRFPQMKHLGDISKINGAEVEPVDVITFGSPCQDLSVAGKRAGLKHEANGDEETTRSGLFMEAVRIIKEMREATHGKYPSFALWENVPGAFSSNKGDDFRVVLEELIKIVEPSATVPPADKNGWPYADCYLGDGWSLAYRVFDAQYWGVPQRRRRIHLVLDLRGECAEKVLFEREGLRGYFAESGTPWQGTAGDAENCAGAADREGEGSEGDRGGRGLNAVGADIYNLAITGDVVCSLTAGGNSSTGTSPKVIVPVTLEPGIAAREGGHIYEGVSGTLRANAGDNQMAVVYAIDQQGGKGGANYAENVMPTLCSDSHGTPRAVAYGFDPYNMAVTGSVSKTINASASDADHVGCVVTPIHAQQTYQKVTGPLSARDYKQPKTVCYKYIVRRLTPTECARLQGFADRWGDIDPKSDFSDAEYRFWWEVRNTHAAINGKAEKEYIKDQMLTWYNKLHTDSSEYKMWGNGIALPCALYVMQGIAEALEAVRCGECIHVEQKYYDLARTTPYFFCKKWEVESSETDTCKEGERFKEEENVQ